MQGKLHSDLPDSSVVMAKHIAVKVFTVSCLDKLKALRGLLCGHLWLGLTSIFASGV